LLSQDEGVVAQAEQVFKSMAHGAGSHVLDLVWKVIESGVTVNLVVSWIEQEVLLVRRRGRDAIGWDHPNACTLLSAGIHISGVIQCHFGISSMQASHMSVGEPLPTANEDFPKGPMFLFHKNGD